MVNLGSRSFTKSFDGVELLLTTWLTFQRLTLAILPWKTAQGRPRGFTSGGIPRYFEIFRKVFRDYVLIIHKLVNVFRDRPPGDSLVLSTH